eukprot:6189379-Amphidinium_carterae.1
MTPWTDTRNHLASHHPEPSAKNVAKEHPLVDFIASDTDVRYPIAELGYCSCGFNREQPVLREQGIDTAFG